LSLGSARKAECQCQTHTQLNHGVSHLFSSQGHFG
jgi:hypothetical protein